MRKQFIFGLCVSVLCLYFVFRGLSFRQVGGALAQADIRWVLVAMGVYACGYGFRALRWERLLQPIKRIPALPLLGPLIIGFFANNVLPFRMGELIRAHVTGKKFHISRTASLGTIFIERICDALAFLTTFLVVAFFFPFPENVKHGAYALAAGCGLAIASLIFAIKFHQSALRLMDRFSLLGERKAKFQHLLTSFTQGVSGITEKRYVANALGLSLIIWVIEGTTLYLITRAFPVQFSYPQAFFVLFFLGLSVTLPQAPGYVGTIELFGVTALGLLGIPRESGLPIILAVHGSEFFFIAILGVWALWKEGTSLGQILHEKDLKSS